MLKVGILGTGMISDSFMKAITQIDGIEVTAVFHRELNKAELFAQKYNISKTYDHYDQLLSDSSVNAIYVGLPNSLHFAYGIAALKAAKTVLMEKPFASNMREFTQLIEAAKAHHSKIFEITRVLSLPNYNVIKNQLETISPIRMITINYSQYSRKYNDYLAGNVRNVFSDEYSGGALTDLGVYGIHFLVGLFNQPLTVQYIASQLPNTIDVGGVLVCRYPDFIASVVQSKNSKAENNIAIQGENGSIYAYPIASRLETVVLDTQVKSTISTHQSLDSMAYALLEIVTIIKNNDEKSYQKRLEHSRMVMEVLDQARQSANIVYLADK